MSFKVSAATASPFLSILIRQALKPIRGADLFAEDRAAVDAQRALRQDPHLAIVDALLFIEGEAGDALRQLVVARRGATIVIDARAQGVPSELTMKRSLQIVRSRKVGQLDLGALEADLRQAIDAARRSDGGLNATPRAPVPQPDDRVEPYRGPLDLIVLGVSTGGPTLLTKLLKWLDRPTTPMLIVQHMPASETAGYAARLAEASGHPVVEVARGPLPPGGVIGLVRGGQDYRILRLSGGLHLREATVPGNPFHPSVDEILTSAVAADLAFGAVILTGMGQDGALGVAAMGKKGLPVIAQRPSSCAVAGMPQSAIDTGAVHSVLGPEEIAAALNRWSARRSTLSEAAS